MHTVQGVPSELRLGFVDLDFECSTVGPNSAWADENLAEASGQLGKMVEHRDQSQPNPGLSSLGTPCTSIRSGLRLSTSKVPGLQYSQFFLFPSIAIPRSLRQSVSQYSIVSYARRLSTLEGNQQESLTISLVGFTSCRLKFQSGNFFGRN